MILILLNLSRNQVQGRVFGVPATLCGRPGLSESSGMSMMSSCFGDDLRELLLSAYSMVLKLKLTKV